MAVDVSEQAEPVTPEKRSRKLSLSPAAALWALAVLPILLAAAEAYRSPRLNFADYWGILARICNPDGSLKPDELFVLHNDHPAVLVGVVFWLNGQFLGATNYGLGFACVVLVLIMLAALVRMLPASLTGVRRAAVVAGLSLLLFSSTATEYFGIGMSGMHWLLGIVPSVLAISSAHRGRTSLAIMFAVIGSLGHGVAFPVWIVLALIAWLRRDDNWRIFLPLLLGVVTFVLWTLPSRPLTYDAPMLLGADTYLGSAVAMLGQIWSAKAIDFAFLAGTATTVVLVTLIFSVVRSRAQGNAVAPDATTIEDAGWFGLGLHSVLVAVMIGVSRGKYGPLDGLSPRYAMVALLGAAALLVLIAQRGPSTIRTKLVPLVLVVGLSTFAIGTAQAGAVREKYPMQPQLAVAMKLEAKSVMSRMQANPVVLPVLRSMGVYPFTGDFTLGCKGPELGTQIDLSTVKDLPAPAYGAAPTAGAVEAGPVIGDTQISGWAVIKGNAADCVVVVDQTGLVVGGGAVGIPRGDIMQFTHATGRAGWLAVAKPGTKDGVVLVISEGVAYRLVTLG